MDAVARTIEGKVESVDSAGNLITNIHADQLENAPRDERVTIICDEHETHGIYSSTDTQPEMTYIGIITDDGRLQLTIVGESAHLMLGIQVGEKVVVKWT